MDRGRYRALRFGYQTPLLYLLTNQYNRSSRPPEVLLKRQIEFGRYRHDTNGLIRSRPLVIVRMYAPVVASQVLEEIHESHVGPVS